MKFLCGNCKAKYQIADEKASGRTLRMKCRRCGHDILIDGHNMAGSSPPSSPVRRSNAPAPPRGGSGAGVMPGLPRPPSNRPRPPSALGAEFRRHVAAPPEVPQRTAPYDLWHVAIHDVPVGPMTRDELARKVETGAVTPGSLCWREGMDDWRPLSELPELAQVLRKGRGDAGSTRPSARARSVAPPTPPIPPRPSSAVDSGDDDLSAPTRIADLPLTGKGSSSVPAAAPEGSTAAAMPLPAAAPAAAAPVAAAPTLAAGESSRGRDRSGLTTGIAVGLLLGILLMGGPFLYRHTWGSSASTTASEAPQAAAPQATAPSVAEEPAAIEMDLGEEPEVDEPSEDDAKPEVATGKAKPSHGRVRRPGAAGAGSKDKLSDAERRLLARMGGGGGDVPLADVARSGSAKAKANSGPSLTSGQLSGVVQKNKVQLQRCYESALRATGGRHENTIKVTVSVTVGASGTTKGVSTQGGGLGNMTTCIRQAVKRWRFPASGGESEFAFPLVFQPGA